MERKNRKKRAYRVIILLLVLAVVSVANCSRPNGVVVAKVRTASFKRTVTGVGKLEACRPCYVCPGAGGAITELMVQDGDTVEAGAVLATLDQQALEEDVLRAQANYLTESSMGDILQSIFSDMNSMFSLFNSAADAFDYQKEVVGSLAGRYSDEVTAMIPQLPPEVQETARGLLDRMNSEYQALLEGAPSIARVSGSGYPGAAASADEARAEVARLEYEKAQQRLASAQITSPASGVVYYVPLGGLLPEDLIPQLTSSEGGLTSSLQTLSGGLDKALENLSMEFIMPEMNLKAGSVLREGKPAFMIVDPSRMVVRLKVDEADAPLVKAGQSVEVSIDAIPRLVIRGVVTRVSARAAMSLSDASQYEVTAELDTRGLDLKLGYTASAIVTVAEKSAAVMLPLEAVLMEPAPHVLVLEKGKAHARRVELGLEDGDRVEVTTGVKPGEQVVVKGARKVKEGAGL